MNKTGKAGDSNGRGMYNPAMVREFKEQKTMRFAMKKKATKKTVKAYSLTAKETESLEMFAKTDLRNSETFKEFCQAKTGNKYTPAYTEVKKTGKGKDVTKEKIRHVQAWSKGYAEDMKRIKVTIEPIFRKAGFTKSGFNSRFSQLIKLVYGTSMQQQKHLKRKGDSEYTIDVDNKDIAGKQFLSVYNALLEKYGKVWIENLVSLKAA